MKMSLSPFRLQTAAFVAFIPFLFSLPAAAESPTAAAPYQVGEWLPSDQKTLDDWLSKLAADTQTDTPNEQLAPVIQELGQLIESDPELYMQFTQMFEQIPNQPAYAKDPTGAPQIRDYHQMLRIMNRLLTQAPAFNQTDMVGFPINAILNWPMGTPAGTTAFLNPKLNRQLKKILDQWAVFLESADSTKVLNDDPHDGWFGRDAMAAMPDFAKDFICDPKQPHWGFSSWDDFFTRQFREGRRPVASPQDDAVIANACESAPYRLATDVKLYDQFWIKAQPYSLAHIFGDEELGRLFEGGTIYQAFLSALSYHRWHSPVSGTVLDTRVIDGSYYAEAASAGFDPAAPNESQGYIAQVAARGVVLIEADNPDIGLMAAVFVGMAEVSSNEFTVYPGQHIQKGDQLGMFHFGGSTHLLVFRPGVNLEFDLRGQEPGPNAKNIPVRAKLATVSKPAE